jgi:hypothetical protein
VSLLDVARADLLAIASDTSAFSVPVLVISPAGEILTIPGLAADIGQTVDPATDQVVLGRRITLAFPKTAFPLTFGEPRGIADNTQKPWLVRFADVHGIARTFKVTQVAPDSTVGMLVCVLEAYRTGA